MNRVTVEQSTRPTRRVYTMDPQDGQLVDYLYRGIRLRKSFSLDREPHLRDKDKQLIEPLLETATENNAEVTLVDHFNIEVFVGDESSWDEVDKEILETIQEVAQWHENSDDIEVSYQYGEARSDHAFSVGAAA